VSCRISSRDFRISVVTKQSLWILFCNSVSSLVLCFVRANHSENLTSRSGGHVSVKEHAPIGLVCIESIMRA
jgi:hypothetical protein